MLLRLLRASACFSARLICIMKSNRNAFYVNSGRIAYDRQFVIADPNEIKTFFCYCISNIPYEQIYWVATPEKKSPRVFLLKEVYKFD